MHLVLFNVAWIKFCASLLINLLLFTSTMSLSTVKQHVRLVLVALSEAHMILNLEKCAFFVTEIRFLGYIVSANGSRPDPRNIEKILNWPTPRTITDVRGFNNLAGHYRRYIPKFAEKSLPLTDLQKGAPKKGSAIAWGEREEAAFRTLKEALTTEPILKYL